MMSFSEFLPEMIATIVGVALGGMGAIYSSRRQLKAIKKKRAEIFLKNLENLIILNTLELEKYSVSILIYNGFIILFRIVLCKISTSDSVVAIKLLWIIKSESLILSASGN